MASGDQDKHKHHDDHDSDDENTVGNGYKAPQKMDICSIVAKDENDESLTRYKKLLLGNSSDGQQIKNQVIDPNDSRIVIPIRITLLFDNHKPDITFELKGSLEQLRDLHSKRSITIKEGEHYRTQLEYYVQRDIVTGLKLVNKVLKARTITVDKSKYMIGSRAPSGELQKYVGEVEQAPSGVLSRGSFLVKSKLTDDDKNIYAEWEWNLVIGKDWQ
jgi:Rho GDP-dissociation inhibitor